MSLIATRFENLPPSPTLAITAKAAALKEKGVDVLSLSAGEPDFDTPEWVKAAATAAMARGATKYTAVEGTKVLREAIQAKLKRENGLTYSLDEIVVSTGAKQAIYNALMVTLNPGEEVLIPAPYWVSYPTMVEIAGGIPRVLPCGPDFKLTPETLRAAVTPRTKWLILNSPSNPSGLVYTAEELAALGAAIADFPDLYVLSDEIYEHLVYDGQRMTSFVAAAPSLRNRTLTVNGVAKSYAMTGWRIGYAAGPRPLIAAMTNLQSQSTSNACSISQAATVAALTGPQEFLAEWRAVFEERRNFCVSALNKVPGLHVGTPGGAFYLYVDCSGVLGKTTSKGTVLHTDVDFCAYLLEDAHVACVPGEAFGLSPYIRLSYATSDKILKEACARINNACVQLRL